MSRLVISSMVAAGVLLSGCSSSDNQESSSPKTTCSLWQDKLLCKCAANPGDGGAVPSCKETMFTSPGLCCIDDTTNECSCMGYSCDNGRCTWGAPFGNLTATGSYCCVDSSSFGGHYGECHCSQYEACTDRETQVQECSADTMPRTCPQTLRKVDTCTPQQ